MYHLTHRQYTLCRKSNSAYIGCSNDCLCMCNIFLNFIQFKNLGAVAKLLEHLFFQILVAI